MLRYDLVMEKQHLQEGVFYINTPNTHVNSIIRYYVDRCGSVWCGVDRCGVVWIGVVWCGVM